MGHVMAPTTASNVARSPLLLSAIGALRRDGDDIQNLPSVYRCTDPRTHRDLRYDKSNRNANFRSYDSHRSGEVSTTRFSSTNIYRVKPWVMWDILWITLSVFYSCRAIFKFQFLSSLPRNSAICGELYSSQLSPLVTSRNGQLRLQRSGISGLRNQTTEVSTFLWDESRNTRGDYAPSLSPRDLELVPDRTNYITSVAVITVLIFWTLEVFIAQLHGS
ncbi:hypothetical protein EDB83DRAFT_1063462 [Lactarius deliciosus]|nr:hypothetical protein EDB83DRAFT_1063462 [Lactarius deliciosus]